MAGFIINLDSLVSLEHCAKEGVYGTKLKEPPGFWRTNHEATLGDYVTMKPGDNVYFFIQRMIYGIGELVTIGDDCKFNNFPEASQPTLFNYSEIKDSLLWDDGPESVNERWICTFKPAPYFFERGIDMDKALCSHPTAFKTLRFFWRRSFIKIDDEENQALRDVMLKTNQDILGAAIPGVNVVEDLHAENHRQMSRKLPSASYSINVNDVLQACATADCLGHEMALETGLLQQMAAGHPATASILGTWDFLAHQVPASPFKPADYIDRMDIFGYSYIPGFAPTVGKYLVAELKKDAAIPDDVEQVMKYVDWVRDEYAGGDYSVISAFLIAKDFDDAVVLRRNQIAKRYYTVGIRPASSGEWNQLGLIKYTFNETTNKIDLREF